MLRIIDPRSNSVTGEVLAHEGVKGGRAIWLGEKEWIFSAGFGRQSERKIAIWDPKNLSKPLTEQTVDNAAGVIMPIYDNSSSIVFTAGRGDCSIRYYEIVNDSTIIYFLSSYSSTTPQQGVAAMPKVGVDVLNNEIMRLYKATPTTIEPVSFRVPRRSDSFQSDLFPDVPGTTPALTAKDWLSNKNSKPVLQSLAPSGDVQRQAAAPEREFTPVVKEPKVLSQAALEAQNRELTSRVSFLEAELVKKDAMIKQLKE
ncbi:coronin-A-like [Schistocerca gregaria]|uniref:coronin-A-like n=1 Tax=Schistocerca gregaria TaxID=7010 RepID=UPI00211E9AC3|nr:coronin-A-like [Schistocerca gregaria]